MATPTQPCSGRSSDKGRKGHVFLRSSLSAMMKASKPEPASAASLKERARPADRGGARLPCAGRHPRIHHRQHLRGGRGLARAHHASLQVEGRTSRRDLRDDDRPTAVGGRVFGGRQGPCHGDHRCLLRSGHTEPRLAPHLGGAVGEIADNKALLKARPQAYARYRAGVEAALRSLADERGRAVDIPFVAMMFIDGRWLARMVHRPEADRASDAHRSCRRLLQPFFGDICSGH